jgi:hypothetical protein
LATPATTEVARSVLLFVNQGGRHAGVILSAALRNGVAGQRAIKHAGGDIAGWAAGRCSELVPISRPCEGPSRQ